MVDLKEFVQECVELAGGLAEPEESPEGGLLEVLVPEPLQPLFPNREVVRLALEGETARRHPEALPALPGSEALDALVEYASHLGRVTHAFPRTDPVRARPIAGEILHALTFTARRVRLPETSASVETIQIAQFDFIVSLVSDEREELLRSVVVDLWSGRASEALSRIVHGLEVNPTGPQVGRRDCHTVEEAYPAACEALETWMAPRIEQRQALVSRRLRDEHGRLRLYYRGLVEDLERRAERAGPEERRAEFQQKIEATRREQESKLAELSEKYRLRPSARLAAVRVLAYPRLFSTVGLDRKQTSRELEVCWDPLLARLLLPVCDACAREATHLTLELDGRLLCPACAVGNEAG